MTATRIIKPTGEEVARAFAEHLVEITDSPAIFNIALSGGSTPKLLFRLLAEDYSDSIDWSRIHFYWGDERCVPPENADSNFKMTSELLFQPLGISDFNIHRINGEEDPELEASRYSTELLRQLPITDMLPEFDLIMLGMGEDGHTASIFPHEDYLLSVDQICAVATHPESGQKRVTITGKTINNAKEVAFLVTGKGKQPKLAEIFSGSEGSKRYPAAHIKSKGVVTWYLDTAANPD